MKFMFFTFGGQNNWEDVYSYQGWAIQKNINSTSYRLIDPYNIRRHAGSFEQCRDILMDYIKGFELDSPYDDSIVLIPGYGQSKKTMLKLAESLKSLNVNVIIFNNAGLKADLNYHAKMLTQFLKNLDNSGKLSFITTSTGGLILRKMISNSNNYRNYNIHRILEINPLNSGSDLAELLESIPMIAKCIGPMLKDIVPQKIFSLSKLPRDIEHGLLFCPLHWKAFFRRFLSRYDSFPISSRPTEESYANIVKKFPQPLSEPLEDSNIIKICKKFIADGVFEDE
ncbi:MAG: hypothetical protein VZR95_00780 [Alphaproteobacteria bacterium]